jgi:hypothetical protein
MKEMEATKRLRYGTRRMLAGDTFMARPRDARLLEAIGRARPYVAPPDPLAPLREEAEAAGVKVDGRWGEDRLREEIAGAAKAKTKAAKEESKPADTKE